MGEENTEDRGKNHVKVAKIHLQILLVLQLDKKKNPIGHQTLKKYPQHHRR